MTQLQLLPECMAVPVFVAEQAIVGRCVFQNFVHEEFQVEGVPDELIEELPDEIIEGDVVADRHIVDENTNSMLEHLGQHAEGEICLANKMAIKKLGATIREIANEFAQSRERQRLKAEADSVDLGTITQEGFFGLLEEVFSHGLKPENLLAVFFFCSDVLISSVKKKMKEIGFALFKWAIQYIVQYVCTWVAENGGWENVLRNTFSKRRIAVMGAAAVGIVAVGGFIYYRYSS